MRTSYVACHVLMVAGEIGYVLSPPGTARRDLELEWEVPFRDLGFTGVPFRTASFVMPTVNCLVAFTATSCYTSKICKT